MSTTAKAHLKLQARAMTVRFKSWRTARDIQVSTRRIDLKALAGLKAPQIYLYKARLAKADLERADLEDANLSGANLKEANLQRANLQGANLRNADLQEADMEQADLERADLEDANLTSADLKNALLIRADLEDTNLTGADLTDADLQDAFLLDTILKEADIDGTKFSLDDRSVFNADFAGTKVEEAKFYYQFKRVIGLVVGKDGQLYAKQKPVSEATGNALTTASAKFGAAANDENEIIHAADLVDQISALYFEPEEETTPVHSIATRARREPV